MVRMKLLIVVVSLLVWGPLLGYAQVQWVPSHPGAKVPKHAIVGGHEGKTKLYVCRARLADGIHPGKTSGGVCIIGQKGGVEHKTKFEIATARHYKWGHWGWKTAFIGGKQFGRVDLYVCRMRIEGAVVPGKAYGYGPHAGHCFVPFKGRERNFTKGFELLKIER